MNPFIIKCNQCKSEDVFFHVVRNILTIYCDHCPASQKIKLASTIKEELPKEDSLGPLFEGVR